MVNNDLIQVLGKSALILFLAITFLIDLQQAYAYISLETDKAYYFQGEKGTISGKITQGENGQQVFMIISASNLSRIRETLSTTNGLYNYHFATGIPQHYHIHVVTGYNNASSVGNYSTFTVLKNYNLKIRNQDYAIGYLINPQLSFLTRAPIPRSYPLNVSSIIPDSKLPKLSVKFNMSSEGELIIELPRNLIQSLTNGGVPIGGSDIPYKVSVNGKDEQPDEVDHSNNARVLDIVLPPTPGIQYIQITGTWLSR